MNVRLFEESDRPPRVIEVEIRGSYIVAHMHYNRTTFGEWCAFTGDDASGFFRIMPDNKLFPIVVLSDIFIGKESGGDDLMRALIEKVTHEARNIAAISDEFTFNLLYSWGFNSIGESKVMILNNY